jgi:hypothetical protein
VGTAQRVGQRFDLDERVEGDRRGTSPLLRHLHRCESAVALAAPRREGQSSELVTWGPFNWSCNPLYNGNYLIWMGFVVVSGVWWFLPVATVIFFTEYTLIVIYEETDLERVFGRVYVEYRARTPRWWPRWPQEPVEDRADYPSAWRSERSTFLQYVVLTIAFVIRQFVIR